MRRFVALAALASALSFTACDSFGQAMTSHTDVLARAAGHELSVDQATALLAPAVRIPAQNEVVDAIANLWVDYTLLATAIARDTSLQSLDLDAVVVPYFNQQLVFQLRDQVIQVDTVLTDEQLRALYEQEQPSAEVRARHILFTVPADASAQARDSITAVANQVLQQARAGADFAQLAAQYSQEPQAAERGGDLGYFGPNSMVKPFEDAAFALDVGEISDLVTTPFGIHIIKLEDKRVPDFDTVKDEFRQSTIQKRVMEAEEQYLTQLTGSRNMAVEEGATEIAKELALKPNTSLSRRAGQRALVTYQGGELTAAEYLALMQQRPAEQRAQVAAAADEQLVEWVRLLARDEILIDEANAKGITTPAAEQDSARMELRRQLKQAAAEAGLMPITPAEGETEAEAIQRQVMAYLTGIINGERQVVPLGAISFTLREEFGAEVLERSIPQVVAQVQAQRPPEQPQGIPPQQMPEMPQQMPQTPPQTTGN